MRYGVCGKMKNGIIDSEIWIMWKEKKHKYEGLEFKKMRLWIMRYGL